MGLSYPAAEDDPHHWVNPEPAWNWGRPPKGKGYPKGKPYYPLAPQGGFAWSPFNWQPQWGPPTKKKKKNKGKNRGPWFEQNVINRASKGKGKKGSGEAGVPEEGAEPPSPDSPEEESEEQEEETPSPREVPAPTAAPTTSVEIPPPAERESWADASQAAEEASR